MRQRNEFNMVRKKFVEKGLYRGFQIFPCKLRILHEGRIQLFATPREAENFYQSLECYGGSRIPYRGLDAVVTMITMGWGAWALSPCGIVLVISILLCLSRPPPIKTADCDRKDHPVVSNQGLKTWMSEFSHPGVKDFSHLVLDLSRNQLIVGARNYLFSLSLSNASLIQETEWTPDEDTMRSCKGKGKSEVVLKMSLQNVVNVTGSRHACMQEECQNYIRVLLLNGRTFVTCGTNAYTRVCMIRQIGNISQVLDTLNGIARCPYDPGHNSTAMISEKGELYAATVIDFSGRDPVIYRSLGNMHPLRTAQYNSKWLNEPQFVSAYDIGRFAYFFLRETAVENDCEKMVLSRVARVCKNDMGGRFLLEDTWTTFMKARLNCSRSGEIPFHYNELQSTFYLPEQDLIYGIFTTNVNSMSATAVCAFNMTAITQAFNGPFLYQENPRMSWLSAKNPILNFQCGTLDEGGTGENLTERNLQDAQRLFLMHDAVQPVTVNPLLTQDNVRFLKLVVDVVQGRDALYHVMYISTEYGTILKTLGTTNTLLHGCYLEELRILPDGQTGSIKSLQIFHRDRSLFVGLDDRLVKIPLERCSSHPTEQRCLEARDPYCGWDHKQERCTTIDDTAGMNQWIQNITHCPVRNLKQDGGFGPWAPWQPCDHNDGEGSISSCICRSRFCDGPVAQCGGVDCKGPTIQVANCSRNGGWTPWSSWGHCNSSCGIGFEVRQRSCNNPSPRHGGRICVGQGQEERLCNEKNPCPSPVLWTAWRSWAQCNAECGGGVQARSRTCENGNTCPGCAMEYKTCNLEACPEVHRNTPWTSWMPVNISQDGSRQEQRYRYMFRALLKDVQQLQFGKKKIETRFCPNDGSGTCQSDSLVNDLVSSSGWTVSQPQAEGRTNPSACVGSAVDYQDCNMQPCPVILPDQEDHNCEIFTLFQLVAVGMASFFVAVLLSALAVTYCHHLSRPSTDSEVIHPSTHNHLTYNKQDNAMPKNEKYIPMEVVMRHKNNLHRNDDTSHHFPSSVLSSNMFTTTSYYPPNLRKYDFPPEAKCRAYIHS
ncbi:semaphorin-5B-like isoform X2 [Syngnathoides biaculeatus]|uniref:semaphorin-5B-like isoform X2 n=1 Tax=Syngnathoides biaculeatus TaxID=300417 RepID=UPI002ADDA6C9|nr:semaphorin-5B-like isoform X2 [Syngnathoides biaculeatus]